MTYTITKNEEYKSFEIHFDAKPDAKTREALKALKFRWHAVRGLWYGYADDENAIRAAGMGYKEYLKDVIKFYAAQGYKPIIDTFQR